MSSPIDKKTKKQLSLLRERTQKLSQQIAAEKKQTDDPRHLLEMQNQLKRLNQEIEMLQPMK